MTIALFKAVSAARDLLTEGQPIERAALIAAAEFAVDADQVACLAEQAHQACAEARANRVARRRAAEPLETSQ